MPSRFLTDKDREQINNFPLTVEENELITHFFLSPTDHEQIALALRCCCVPCGTLAFSR